MEVKARSTVLFDKGDLSAPVGSSEWVRAVHLEAKAAIHDTSVAYQNLEVWITGLREGNHYQQLSDEGGQLFLTWHRFCTTRQPFGLGYSPEALDALLQDRKSAQELAEKAEPLPRNGAIGNGRRFDISKPTEGGTAAEYLTRRIARDRPDILERMKAGEFESVRQAALEAGISHPMAQIRTDDVDAAARVLRRHFSGERLLSLIQALVAEAQ